MFIASAPGSDITTFWLPCGATWKLIRILCFFSADNLPSQKRLEYTFKLGCQELTLWPDVNAGIHSVFVKRVNASNFYSFFTRWENVLVTAIFDCLSWLFMSFYQQNSFWQTFGWFYAVKQKYVEHKLFVLPDKGTRNFFKVRFISLFQHFAVA